MGYFDELKKAPAERVLDAELDDHLESEASEGRANRRNGYSKKTVRTETAKVGVRIPRDREGTFDPKLIQRYQRRFPGFDQDCFDVRARHERAGDPGPSRRVVRDRRLSRSDLDRPDAVLVTVAERQNRPLEASYPLVSSTRSGSRSATRVSSNNSVYIALGVAAAGTKDILGLWIETPRAQILAQGDERTQEPPRRQHPHRRRRRPEALSGSVYPKLKDLRGPGQSHAGVGVPGPVDRPQLRHDQLAVRPGHEFKRIADQVEDAGLDDRAREDRLDRNAELWNPNGSGGFTCDNLAPVSTSWSVHKIFA